MGERGRAQESMVNDRFIIKLELKKGNLVTA